MSGNAAILRGGSEAIHSNRAIHAALAKGLAAGGMPADAVQLVPTTDRAAVGVAALAAGQRERLAGSVPKDESSRCSRQ